MGVRVGASRRTFRMRKIAGLAVWCLLTALMMVAAETPSSANPFFFSKTGQDCKFCHQHGREMSGVEGLNDTGRAFLQTFKRCPDCALRDFAAGSRPNQGATVAPSSSNRPAPQPASGDKFIFHVCNNSRYEASIAVSYRVSRNPDSFHAQGWTNVHPGACSNMGPFPRGGFWYYAFSKPTGRQWSGSVELCVDKSAGFSRTYGKGHQCREDRVQFYFKNVDTSEYSWNLGN